MLVALTGLLLVVLGGCGKQMSQGPAMTPPSAPPPSPPGTPPTADFSGPPAGEAGRGEPEGVAQLAKTAAQSEVPQAAADRKLIRTAELWLVELKDVPQAMKNAEAIARAVGGFGGNTTLQRAADGSQTGSIVVRVPVARFDEVVAKLRELGKLQTLNTNVQDVTAEYVDLDARLRNAQREEQVIVALFDRGGKLADVITVETKLAEVRGAIERLQGQLRVMKEQVDLSTITVQLHEKGTAAVPEAETYDVSYHVRSALRALGRLLQNLLTVAIYVVLLGWVFWVPLWIVIWAVRKRRRARKDAAPTPPPAQP